MTDILRGRDFLSIADLTSAELNHVLDVASAQKRAWARGARSQPLAGMSIALVFQKPSMRTRISFEVACSRLGAHHVTLAGPDSAFSRGESIYDTAKVMERYVDAIVIRTFEQSVVEQMAEHVEIPVINALTDEHHPCQGLADLMTIREHFDGFDGLSLAYVGDGNNMAHTYLLGGALAGIDVAVASPEGYAPHEQIVDEARAIAAATGSRIDIVTDPGRAVAGADIVATDTWASMGQEDEHATRVSAFEPFRIDQALMDAASDRAIFMHCLPAHRGEEVTDAVMDSARSVVFEEAENRLHAQKALLSLLLG